jgi:hypothetical protein
MSCAVAVAHLQSVSDQLSELLEAAPTVDHLLGLLDINAESVLVPVHAVDQQYDHYLDGAAPDCDVVTSAHAALQKCHQQIVGEFGCIANALRFTTTSEATRARSIRAWQVDNLVSLEFFLLRSLTRAQLLRIVASDASGELDERGPADACESVASCLDDARDALAQLHATDATRDRGIMAMLLKNGRLVGPSNDNRLRRVAVSRREEIRSVAGRYLGLPSGSAAATHTIMRAGDREQHRSLAS